MAKLWEDPGYLAEMVAKCNDDLKFVFSAIGIPDRDGTGLAELDDLGIIELAIVESFTRQQRLENMRATEAGEVDEEGALDIDDIYCRANNLVKAQRERKSKELADRIVRKGLGDIKNTPKLRQYIDRMSEGEDIEDCLPARLRVFSKLVGIFDQPDGKIWDEILEVISRNQGVAE